MTDAGRTPLPNLTADTVVAYMGGGDEKCARYQIFVELPTGTFFPVKQIGVDHERGNFVLHVGP